MALLNTTTKKIVAGAISAVVLLIAPFTANFEGKKNKAYLDPVGIPTICYGYTPNVKLGDSYTDEECTTLLYKELAVAEKQVSGCIGNTAKSGTVYPATFVAAMTDFTYNVGGGAFCKSTVAKKAIAGDLKGACTETKKWIYAKGQVFKGLKTRRETLYPLCTKDL